MPNHGDLKPAKHLMLLLIPLLAIDDQVLEVGVFAAG